MHLGCCLRGAEGAIEVVEVTSDSRLCEGSGGGGGDAAMSLPTRGALRDAAVGPRCPAIRPVPAFRAWVLWPDRPHCPRCPHPRHLPSSLSFPFSIVVVPPFEPIQSYIPANSGPAKCDIGRYLPAGRGEPDFRTRGWAGIYTPHK